MRVTVLGSGGAGAPPGRAENCILVDPGDGRGYLLLDAGPGCGQRLLEHGLDPCRVEAVYISHVHLDHWSGLMDIAVYRAARGCGAPRLLAAGGVAEELPRVAYPSLPRSFVSAARLERLEEAPPVAGLRLEPVPGRHAVESYGVIVSPEEGGGPGLYYSADTTFSDRVAEAASRARLVIVEAAMPSGAEEEARRIGHMTPRLALGLLDAMRSGSALVLTHLTAASVETAYTEAGAAAPRAREKKIALIVASDGLGLTV